MKKAFLFLLVLAIFCGCGQQQIETENAKTVSEEQKAVQFCRELCMQERQGRADFSFGPCLSNEIIENWVCDVAHSPRQALDNQPENQCSAFREGKASHFVELDTDCELIKTY